MGTIYVSVQEVHVTAHGACLKRIIVSVIAIIFFAGVVGRVIVANIISSVSHVPLKFLL